ncbi:hypothetical protein [Kitasatospora camelliae]|uniref:Uncharacterized protein n=1 Tax=Kitasatospora camelliae TaxID=3156397 RepID=A0AAU8JVJ3_9ACTN
MGGSQGTDSGAVAWLLKKDETILGELYYLNYDQPWTTCRFEPTPDWLPFRHLFETQEEAVKMQFPEDLGWAFKAVRELDLRLVSPRGGTPVKPWMIYIDGDRARFRPDRS